MQLLVIDVGTSGTRAVVVDGDGAVVHEELRELMPDSPAPGLVEFDAALLATTALDLAREAIDRCGTVAGIAVSNQRASTVVWDRVTGAPIAPALGWQDLRTIGECFAARAAGVRVAPNQSATKAQWLLDQVDADRARDLCFGTVDTWIAWTLSGGAVHVSDASNAAVTGLARPDATGWDDAVLDALRIPTAMMPTIVPTAGAVGEARALPGAPPIVALVGDQQASLAGTGCVRPGDAKITFGTGGMCDVFLGPEAPRSAQRSEHGTFPIVTWRFGSETDWGAEAIMLSAGTNVQWLRDELGVIDSVAQSHEVAQQCADTGDVWFVPAMMGLGTPQWDYGARSTFVGLTRGTGRAEIVRAVLEGIAHRGADLVEAASADTGVAIDTLRIDGGMSANPTFVQALADAAQLPVEISPVREATALGAALLGFLALGHFQGIGDLALTWRPSARVEPSSSPDRDRWRAAVARAEEWIPDLSSIDF